MKVKVYLHNDYERGEFDDEYPMLSKADQDNLFGMLYEVELEYDTNTKKLKVI